MPENIKKHLKFFIVLVAAFVMCCGILTINCFAAQYDNLIINPSLEEELTSYSGPKFLGRTTEKSLDGSYSAKASVGASWAHLVEFRVNEGLVAGKKYHLSCWYYTDAVFEGAKVNMVMNNGKAVQINGSQREPVSGKWTQYSFVFTAPEGVETLQYIYMCVILGSGYGDDKIMYFDNFNLREVPEGTTSLSSVSKDITTNSAELTLEFDNKMDFYNLAENLYLNDEKLKSDEFDLIASDDNSAKISITKTLNPDFEYDFSLGDAIDVFGNKIDLSDSTSNLKFKTLPNIGLQADFYSVNGDEETKLETITDMENVRVKGTAKNNCSVYRECYVVAFVCEGQHIVRTADVTEKLNLNAGASSEIVLDCGEVSKGEYLRIYTWTEISENLRALNGVIEFK